RSAMSVEHRSGADRGSHSLARGCSPRRWASAKGQLAYFCRHRRGDRMTRLIRRGAFAWSLAALVASLGASYVPGAADAQQAPQSRHIGVLLNAFSPDDDAPQALRQGLRDAGYSVGSDVVIEWRAAQGDRSRLPALATDLVQRKVDVIVVDSTPG